MLYQWQPIVGCSPISPGCANCAVAKLATGPNLTTHGKNGAMWTGEVRFDENQFAKLAKLANPHAVSVCSHGDLFNESVPDIWIDRVHDTMRKSAGHGHTFHILTKRARRMRDYYSTRLPVARLTVGISAERQEELDERFPFLMQVPARRQLTLYPLLGPIVLPNGFESLAYVAAGDEDERPADPAWMEALAQQSAKAGVNFIVGKFEA